MALSLTDQGVTAAGEAGDGQFDAHFRAATGDDFIDKYGRLKDFGPFQQDADGKDERKKKRLVAGKAQIEEKTRQKIPEGWFATLEDGPDCQRADRRHDFFRGSQLDFWQEGRYMAEKTA